MRHWKVICTDGAPVPSIAAETWIEALGQAIAQSGDGDRLDRLVCERLRNGTVVARDAATGRRWVVRETEVAADHEGVVLASIVSLVLALAAATTGLAGNGLFS